MIQWNDSNLIQKTARLKNIITSFNRVIIAFSGGCDSALVAKLSKDLLGFENALAVTTQSESLARDEIQEVEKFVQTYQIRHRWIVTREIENPNYTENLSHRCYFCKSELYDHLLPLAESWRADAVFNGINVDDLGDWRPGIRAAREREIKSPLLEAGFNKEDIRGLSKKLQLFTWDKPAAACLSSRFAYGQTITPEQLRKVDQGEQIIRSYGFRIVRLRKLAANQASIEVGPNETARLFDHPQKQMMLHQIKSLGFDSVVIDPEGYVTGKMNRPTKAVS